MQNQMQSKGGYEMAYGVKVYWRAQDAAKDASDKSEWTNSCEHDLNKLYLLKINLSAKIIRLCCVNKIQNRIQKLCELPKIYLC